MAELQTHTVTDIWMVEPRWSWFGSPLWECAAVNFEIRRLKPDNIPGTGSLTSARFDVPYIEVYHLYFTTEEYVMWRLDPENHKATLDMNRLRTGIIYYG